MSVQALKPSERVSLGRGALAVGAGFVTNFALSHATDEVAHLLGVYPPWESRCPKPSTTAWPSPIG